jgi:hypothetical protein
VIPYVETKLILPGANVESIVQGEKIQELQASLACALRMPIDKIRIRKFYRVTSDGAKEALAVNPEDFYIIGDGTEGCYTVNATGARRLQVQGGLSEARGESVEVEYVIVEPPQAIVELSTAQLTTVLATSDAMVSTVQSVGSTGIEAAAITVPVVSTLGSNDFTTVLKTVVGPAIGGGLGGLIVLTAGIIVGIKIYKKKKQSIPLTQKGVEVTREGQHLHKNPLHQVYDSTRALGGLTGNAYAGRGPVNRASQDMTRVAMEPTHVGHAV